MSGTTNTVFRKMEEGFQMVRRVMPLLVFSPIFHGG
jgi:hypothetical protein